MNHLLPEKDAKAVLEILTEELGVEQSQLTTDARLKEDLGADSLSHGQFMNGFGSLAGGHGGSEWHNNDVQRSWR